ncbi:MAG TPA: hypothetical protein VGQ26_07185 [Streptosporangiaceae bacterium]|jgi:hypothetical protein|nr:hypothetical protein [Streptosporangiaceae bacterium]
MPDPPDSQQHAEFLVLVLEDWCRRRRFDGDPPLREGLREALATAAASAPHLAALCPHLRRELSPRAAWQVSRQASALARVQAASEMASAANGSAAWMTTAEAGRALAIAPDSVRWLLRRGLISGRRGWLVNSASVITYAGRRRNGETAGRSVAPGDP